MEPSSQFYCQQLEYTVRNVISFAHPEFLFLLILVPLFWLWWLHRKQTAILFADLRLFASLPHGRCKRVRWIVLAARCLICTATILALSGPRIPDWKTRIPVEGIGVVFVLDVSPSMEARTFDWNGETISRSEAAKRAFRLFVAGGEGPDGIKFEGRSTERGTDAIGLVTFAIWPQPISPPTLNHSVLLKILEDQRPPQIPETGTNIGDAIAEGLIRLQPLSVRRKVLILLSDGEHNYDLDLPDRKPLRPLQAAQLAANLQIPIYTIDTGGELPITDANDPSQKSDLQQRLDGRATNDAIAKLTNGRSFTANSGTELLEVYQEIDQLERQPILSFTYRRYHELYPWFSGLAFVCLLALMILERTTWRTFP